MLQRFWQSIAALISRRYVAVIVGTAVVAAVFAIGLPQLKFETSQDTLIGKNTRVAQQSRKYQKEFGGEAMLVMYTGPSAQLATPENQKRFVEIENTLKKTGLFDTVISPRTAINLAADQIPVGPAIFASSQQAYPDKKAELQARLDNELRRLGAAGPATFSNPKYVDVLLHEQDGTIRSALQDNYPDDHHGLMVVRLKGNTSIADVGNAADQTRKIVEAHKIPGFTVLATGPPLLLKDINDYLQGGMTTLGALAVGVMIAVLLIVWRRRWRLLSLVCVLVGIVGAFGLMGWIGIPLNLVTISGFPILVGMGVDFAIQMHSRFEEELEEDTNVDGVLQRVMGHLGPALAVALIAAMVGFLALQVSKVPMIKQFGAMLDLGVAVLFVCVIFLPLALLTWRERRWPTSPLNRAHPRGALERFVRTLATVANRWVIPMLLIGTVVVVAGFWAEGRFTIQTDPEKWLPQGGSTVKSLASLREGTGFSTELDFFVSADDVTKTENAAWLQRYVEAELKKHKGEIIHGSSFGNIQTTLTQQLPEQGGLKQLLNVTQDPKNNLTDIPKAFYSEDKTKANVVFPIANISLGQRKQLLKEMQADLKSPALKPPQGVDVEPYGLVVVGIALVDALQSNRYVMTLLALGLVAAWLLLFYRNFTKTALTLVPVLLAVGASSLAVYATGLELSPLTAVSGPLVIAVCTEFAILILSRYVEERGLGLAPEAAVDLGIVRIGRAFVASGLTLIGGFGVLALSSFPLLRDFGIIVALNAVIALLCALIVLPPLLVAADKHPRMSGFKPGGEGFGSRRVRDDELSDAASRAETASID